MIELKHLSKEDMAHLPDERVLQYNEVPEGWEGKVFSNHKGECLVAIYCGTEVHISVHPDLKKKALSRKLLRDVYNHSKLGFLTTKMLKGDKGAEFIKRIGFEFMWSDENFDYYLLDKPPYTRGKK